MFKGDTKQVIKRQLAYNFRRKMTPSEQKLWQFLRRSALSGLHFRRQEIIAGFIVDFYCHAAQLVVEIDGAVHENQQEYDRARSEILTQRGLLVIRFTNTQVETDIRNVLDEILAIAKSQISKDTDSPS